MTLNPELITASDLDDAAGRLESMALIPRLIRRLLTRTPGVEGVTLRADEGIRLRGWDGKVAASAGSPYVPVGASCWEIGTGQDPKAKADEDLEKRTKDPLGLDPADTAFVFVTSRRWAGKEEWVTEAAGGIWREVRALDADDLYGWLELMPAVHTWISEELGRRPLGVETLERWWVRWSTQTQPTLPPELLLAGRDKSASELHALVDRAGAVIGVKAQSRDEALGFIAAALLHPRRTVEEESAAGEGQDEDGDHVVDREDTAQETRDAHLDDAPATLVVVVSEPQAWRRLVDSPTPLVLVVATESADIAAASAAGHVVLRPLGPGDGDRGADLEVPRLDRARARSAFEPISTSFEEADRRAAAARRSLLSLRRSLRRDPVRARPHWAQPPVANTLAPLLLSGAWLAGSDDCEVISELTGADYRDLERQLGHLAASDDPPLRRGDREWHLSSPEDAWDLLSSLITGDDTARWRGLALQVLGETDPLSQLQPAERQLGLLRGEGRRWSGALRRGLAEGAALLGAAEPMKLSDGTRAADHASALVRTLLAQANEDRSGALWQSLHDVLPLLAEAAPEAFLDAVDRGVDGDPPVLRLMFTDGPETSVLTSTSPHTGLLWALEGLCWSEQYLTRACLALALLETIDPGGRLGNRPARSLRRALLLWMPCTRAPLDRRMAALDAVRTSTPEVGFDLMLAIWPRRQDHSSPNHLPRFRDWQRESARVPPSEQLHAVSGLVDRALEEAGREPQRWVELMDRIAALPEEDQTRAVAKLEQLNPDDVDRELRVALWRVIVELVGHHRHYPDADWAMPESQLARFDAVAARIEPADAVERHARLFEWRPDLPGVDQSDHRAYEDALQEARAEAVREAFTSGGIEAVVTLAGASRLRDRVGAAAAASLGDDVADEMFRLLGGDEVEAQIAVGWVRYRNWAGGADWAKGLTDDLAGWPDVTQVRFLLALPAGDATTALAEHATSTARAQYWQEVTAFTSGAEAEALAERLLDAGRAWAALDLIALYAHERPGDPDDWQPDADLILQVLNRALTEDPTEALRSGSTAYDVGGLLDRLEKLGVDRTTLARMEWSFESLLSHDRPPRALFAELADNPSLFVEMVAGIYSPDPEDAATGDPPSGGTSDGGTDESAEGDEESSGEAAPQEDARREALVENAWSVLHNWRTPPGVGPDGKVDSTRLRDWVLEARRLFAERGRRRIGDDQLGALLAGAPAADDGIWPPEAVRDLVEEFESEQFDDGLETGRFNSRGITSRGAYTGGEPERELAARFTRDAEMLEGGWPRTARILRGLASTYERMADDEDEEAGRRADWG